MVIRRVRDHVATHNWFAVAIDVAIVVVGVFLGMQVNNWNEGRIERQEGIGYRARLLDELNFNERQLGQQILYYRAVRGHALAALRSYERPSGGLGAAFLVDSYQATQINPERPKRFIFDEMVSAGQVDRIGSETLQAQASDYYRTLDAMNAALVEIQPYRDLLRGMMPYDVQQAIRSTCSDQDVYWGGRRVGLALPASCAPNIAPASQSAAVARLRQVATFDSALTRYAASIDQKLGTLQYGLDETHRLKALLSAADK